MFITGYNPNLHDIYLYGDGNTGFPIGLNPNCIIFDAKESYKWMNVIYRDWVSPRSGLIPPGLSAGAKPNYYNADVPRSYWVGPNFLFSTTHFHIIPCINANYAGQGAFESKSLGGYEADDFKYWSGEFTSFIEYPDLDYIYELTENPIAIGEINYYNNSTCPLGIPGIPDGATFYRVTNKWDAGILKVHDYPDNQTRLGPFLRTVSIYSLLTDEQKNNINNYIQRQTQSLYTDDNYAVPIIEIPVDNLYLIGGNQTVAPVQKLKFIIASFYGGENLSGYGIGFEIGPETWGGDSSGIIVYKKNGELFGIGMLTGGGLQPDQYTNLNTERYPSMEYLLNHTDIPITYYYSNTDELTLATNTQFTELSNKLNTLVQKFQSAYNNITG
jgi:hypothetical protein